MGQHHVYRARCCWRRPTGNSIVTFVFVDHLLNYDVLQPIVNFNEWRLLYFIAFILLVGFFVLNMFVGVVVENFHRCREEQEKEEKIRRAAKRALQMEKKRRRKYKNYNNCGGYLLSLA